MFGGQRVADRPQGAGSVWTLLLLISPFFTRPATAQGTSPRDIPGLSAMDSMVSAEYAKDSIGSMTVGIVNGGDLVWTKSYGFANTGSRKLADRRTVYRIGSITKMFTATMLLQLVDIPLVRARSRS